MLLGILFVSTVYIVDNSMMDIVPKEKLPKEAINWDPIGSFALKDEKGKHVSVVLYVCDSEAVSQKAAKKGKSIISPYPNVFTVHAMYLDTSNTWVHIELFSCARVRFNKVGKVDEHEIVLKLRPSFVVGIENGKIMDAVRREKEINKEFFLSLILVKGVPEVKN